MDKIIALANSLANEIENCELRKNYLIAKQKIEDDKILLAKVKEFKLIQVEFQSKILGGLTPSFEDERIISKIYSDLTLEETARNFLEYEQQLLTLVVSIHETISKSCAIEVNF